jgi:hypothetical protein
MSRKIGRSEEYILLYKLFVGIKCINQNKMITGAPVLCFWQALYLFYRRVLAEFFAIAVRMNKLLKHYLGDETGYKHLEDCFWKCDSNSSWHVDFVIYLEFGFFSLPPSYTRNK